MKIRKLYGFTLIELLVVIAIIAVLMAILMPSLEKARRQGRRIACAGNLKNMGYACVMYSDDYDYQFPYCHMVKISNSGSYAIWNRRDNKDNGFVAHGLLYYHGLIKNPLVFYCPANRDPSIRFGEAHIPGVWQGVGGGWPETGRVPEDVPSHQQFVQSHYHYRSLWDGHKWRALNSAKDGGGMAFMADVFTDPVRGVQNHHKTGYNVAFADGHSEFVKDEDWDVENAANGSAYHVDHTLQDYVWKTFFDKVKKYPAANGTI